MSTAILVPFQRGFALVVALALLLSAMVPLVATTPVRASSHVWINEFHYDNTGTDAGEAIEVAGAAGTDLTGWTIVLYNGANGAAYDTDPLSGTLADDQGGFGTAVISYPSNGIQNGSPDGIALVDAAGAVVQFLSYEGTITAVGGPADGMTSTDIGVLQDGTDPVGDSLQLIGAGTSYGAFTWTESQPDTFGNVNTGQTFGAEALPSLHCPNLATDVGMAASTLISATDANGTVTALDLTSVTPSTTEITLSDFSPSASTGEPATATLGVSGTAPVGTYTVQLTASTDDDPAQAGTCSLTVSVDEPIQLPDGVVISEVYGGGGNDGATLTNDFIELYNMTDAEISLEGWSVQYARFDGTSWQATTLGGSIAPGGYYLIQQAAGRGGSQGLPTPDAIGSIAMSATSGKVALVPVAEALSGSCPLAEAVDFVGYGSAANCFEGSAPAEGLSNITAAIRANGGATDSDDNLADFDPGSPDPQNSDPVTEPPVSCDTATHSIHDVQGSGASSELAGQTVTIEGVVTGFFRGDDLDEIGYFVQEEDEEADGNPLTSEGIMVHDPANLADVDELPDGAVISVRGTVHEHFGKTRLTSVSGVADCGITDAVTVVDLSLPAADSTSFERYEGMLVQFEQALTISEYFNFDRFGEIVLTVGRDFQPTAVVEPGSPEAEAIALDNQLNRIGLDDATSLENPDPARHPNGEEFTLENRFRGGDTVSNVTGVLDYAFGQYRVQPTQGADYAVGNPRPAAPDDVGGSLTVASFNVLNYFTTIDDGTNDICGPARDQECRGADNAEELERQRAKIIAALAAMNSDVVGLIEIENHPGDVPTADLVAGLNDVLGAGTYDYVETGAIGTDAIRVALIYQPAAVTPVGAFAILDSGVDVRFDDEKNRPVLAQAFEENATGGVVTVAVNHLKSKGSSCGPGDDDPVQGNCNGTRAMAADALVDWLATDPTGSGDLDSLIIGDLNAYDKEDPIDEVRAGPDDVDGTTDDYTDLVLAFEGEHAYSYLFGAQLGYLDHGLASATLSPQVTGATVWHINADEPDILDYDTSFKKPAQDALYAPDPYRSSDHDPVIVGLDLLAYGFDELEPPIDESNTARAGSTIPVKFGLAGEFGPDVLFGPPQVVACGESPPFADSEDARTTGRSGFRYNAGDDQYVFTWKTDRAWAGDCKALVLTLRDGTYVIAEFEFR